MSKSAKVVIV